MIPIETFAYKMKIAEAIFYIKKGLIDPDQDFCGLHDRIDRLTFGKLQVLCRVGGDDRDYLGSSLEGYDDLGIDRALLHHLDSSLELVSCAYLHENHHQYLTFYIH